MTAFWRRLFHREADHQGETTQRTQNTKPQWTLTRLFGSPSGKQRPPETDMRRINCQERIHYPIYDPNNPRHNPNAPKHGTYSGWASFGRKKGRSKAEGRSTTKSLRRAGSTIVTLFRRPPIPFGEEVPEINHNEPSPLARDNPRQNREDHDRSSQPEDLGSIGATTASSSQLAGRPDSDMSVGGHRTRAFIRCQRRPLSSSDQIANLTGNESNQARLTGDDGICDPFSVFAAKQSTTPPPSYDSLPNGNHEAHGSVDFTLPVVSTRPEGGNNSRLFSASTMVNEAENRCYLGSPILDDPGTAGPTLHDFESAKLSCQLPDVLCTDTDASTSTTPHTPATRLSSGGNKAGSERSGSLPSLEAGKQWLDVPKQRPLCAKTPSEAGTEVDSEFGVDIYRTTCHRERDATAEGDPLLLQSWLSSSSISQSKRDKQRPVLGILNSDDSSMIQADPEAAKLPATANLSFGDPETSRLTVRSKSVYSDNESRCEDHGPDNIVAETPAESASVCTSGSAKHAEHEQKSSSTGSLLDDTRSKVKLEVMDPLETGASADAHCQGSAANTQGTQFESSPGLGCPSDPPMQGLRTLRYAVEAIDRLTGFELADGYANLDVPLQGHNRTGSRQLRRCPGHTEGSSSGSNESGQSDPASSSTARTICSSASSACDSAFLVKEGIAEKHTMPCQPERPVKPVETALTN